MNARELDQLFHQTARKIMSAEITGGQEPAPGGAFEQDPRVIATLDDGSRVELFACHTRERTFNPADFVGLSVEQARRLQ
jgi:hypothetical protein